MQEKYTNKTLLPKFGKGGNPLNRQIKNEKRFQYIVDQWEHLGFYKVKRYSETYRKYFLSLTKLTKGTLFITDESLQKWAYKEFTEEEILQTINQFALIALDANYLPTNKEVFRKVNLSDFLYNPYRRGIKSYFLFTIENPPVEILVDKYPNLTEYLIDLFVKKLRGNQKIVLSQIDKNNFVRASIRLTEYIQDNKDKIRPYFRLTNERIADWLFESIIVAQTSEVPITSGYFCSNKTFNDRLPSYLVKQAIIEREGKL